jgi:hypothetical protein
MGGRMTTERIPQGLRSRPRHEVVILVNGTGARRAEMPRDRPLELAGRAEGSARAALCAPRMLVRATVEVTSQERAASPVLSAGTRRAA